MEITTNKQILGLRVMHKHHTVYEVHGLKGLNNFQFRLDINIFVY
jgi:hypothetical protein